MLREWESGAEELSSSSGNGTRRLGCGFVCFQTLVPGKYFDCATGTETRIVICDGNYHGVTQRLTRQRCFSPLGNGFLEGFAPNKLRLLGESCPRHFSIKSLFNMIRKGIYDAMFIAGSLSYMIASFYNSCQWENQRGSLLNLRVNFCLYQVVGPSVVLGTAGFLSGHLEPYTENACVKNEYLIHFEAFERRPLVIISPGV